MVTGVNVKVQFFLQLSSFTFGVYTTQQTTNSSKKANNQVDGLRHSVSSKILEINWAGSRKNVSATAAVICVLAVVLHMMLFSLLHPFTMSTYTSSSSSHPSIHTHKEVAWAGTLPLPVCPSVRLSVCFYRLVLSHPLLCVMLMTVKSHRQQQQQTNDRPTNRPASCPSVCIHLV